MKFLLLIMTFITSSQAFAHTDHALGEGQLHAIYHAVFWLIFAAVVVKGIAVYKAKKAKRMKK